MNYLDYIKKRIVRDKRNLYIIILFFICALILLISFSYKDTFMHQLDMSFKYDISARSMLVGPTNDVINNMTPEEFENYEYDIEAIKKVDHVDAVTMNSCAYGIETDFKNSKYDGSIGIDFANENIVKSLTGEDLFGEDDYGVAICSKNFYPGSYKYEDMNKLDFYDKELIGHTFKGSYDIFDIDENGEPFRSSQKTREFKIVGVFDSYSIGENYNLCYIGGKEWEEIYNEMIGTINSGSIASIRVIVDNSENVDYVVSELSKMDLKSTLVLVYDHERVFMVKLITAFIIAILTVFIIFISELYVKKRLVKNMNDIKLLYSLGFSKKEITKIHLLNLLLLIACSFIIALLVFFVVISLNKYTPIDLSRISIISFIISVIIIFVIPILIYKISISRLLKNNQKLILGDSE